MKSAPKACLAALVVFFSILTATAQTPVGDTQAPVHTKGKEPVIIIPGLAGSELVNAKTDEQAWFTLGRPKDDDLRLPMSPVLSRNRDGLVAKDIIRTVKFLKFLPETEIYERLVNAFETRGGYKEGSWTSPDKDGYEDTFYVFPYDWRRDNVENARLLIRQIDALKRKLRKPRLKFNIIAHSMGGLIARYAAMYGNTDLASGPPRPTWAGSRDLDKIFLLGTPNEGSVSALSVLLNGFSYIGGGLNLPFVQNIDRFDVFTIPSIFQLLPHAGTAFAYDEDLKPIAIDMFDPAVWDKYGWSVWNDKDFTKKFSPKEQAEARPYFLVALDRAKRFQAALDADSRRKPSVSLYLMGGDCKETPTGAILIHDKKEQWETRFKPDGFTRSDGEKVSADDVKKVLFTVGDGVVSKSSLLGESFTTIGKRLLGPVASELFQCEAHSKLVSNPEIQDKLFLLLNPPIAQ